MFGRYKHTFCDVDGCGETATHTRSVTLGLCTLRTQDDPPKVVLPMALCTQHATDFDESYGQHTQWHAVAEASLLYA